MAQEEGDFSEILLLRRLLFDILETLNLSRFDMLADQNEIMDAIKEIKDELEEGRGDV